MTGITVTCDIAASADRVFEVFTDLTDAPDRIEGIQRLEVLTNGPVGVGTRFRETRKILGKEATEEMEIVSFEQGKGYVTEAESHGSKYRTEFRFEPDERTTRVTMSFQATPVTLGAKLLAPLGKMFQKQMEKLCAKDLEDLKTFLEGGGS